MVDEIYVTAEGSAQMERVEEVLTIEGCGIEGDRYCEGVLDTIRGGVPGDPDRG